MFLVGFYLFSLAVFLIFHNTSLKETPLGKLIYGISLVIVFFGFAVLGIRERYNLTKSYDRLLEESDNKVKKTNYWVPFFTFVSVLFFVLLILTMATFNETDRFADLFILYTKIVCVGLLLWALFLLLVIFFDHLKTLFTHKE